MKPCLDNSSLQHIKFILAGLDFRSDEKFLLEQKEYLLKIYHLSCSGSVQFFTTAITESEINPFDKKNSNKVQESNELINKMDIQILKAPFILDDPLCKMDMPNYVLDGAEKCGLYEQLISNGIQHADARHIVVAESTGCTHFITTDKRLINSVGSYKDGFDMDILIFNPKGFIKWRDNNE